MNNQERQDRVRRAITAGRKRNGSGHPDFRRYCHALWMVVGLLSWAPWSLAADAGIPSAGQGVSAAAATLSDEQASGVEAIFAGCAGPGRPGAAVSVTQGGRTVFEAYYGDADIGKRIPVSASTRFNVASVSKQFTGFAVAILVREGKVDVEADIRRYLPFMPDFGQVIRVKDLLAHTSGLHDQLELLEFSGHDINGILRRQPLINLLSRQRALLFPPGYQYSYSNTNSFLSGEIVRSVTGQSIREFTLDRIFAPLGMKHSDMVDDITEILPDAALSYSFDDATDRWRQMPQGGVEAVGAGGLLTTAADLAKWLAHLGHP